MSDVDVNEQFAPVIEAACTRLDEALAVASGHRALSVELRVLELRKGLSAEAVRVGFRVRDASGGDLDGLRTLEIGTGEDGPAALEAAVATFLSVVIPAVARASKGAAVEGAGDPHPKADGPDLELVQRVPGSEQTNTWAVYLGPPQLRASDDVLASLAASQRDKGLFETLVAEGTLPHFPTEHTFHWVRLWLGRPGGAQRTAMARCEMNSEAWPRGVETLATVPLPASTEALHVLAFAVLRRIDT